MLFARSLAGMLVTVVCGCAHVPLAQENDATAYARVTQEALNKDLWPTLSAALPPVDRKRLGKLQATVVDAGDPLHIGVRGPGLNASFVLTEGFLALQQELIDASVLGGATTGYEAQLVDYAVEVSRYAVKVHRGDPASRPVPFWQYIGWTRERYDTFRADMRYAVLLQRATLQTLAWLLTTAVSEHLDIDATADDRALDAPLRSTRVRQRAAKLMLQARWAPVPPWPAAVLFAAARVPQEQASAQWICSARAVLETAAEQTSRHTFAAKDQANEPDARETALARWREPSQLLAQRGSCDPSTP